MCIFKSTLSPNSNLLILEWDAEFCIFVEIWRQMNQGTYSEKDPLNNFLLHYFISIWF